jgi:hypothetical protein
MLLSKGNCRYGTTSILEKHLGQVLIRKPDCWTDKSAPSIQNVNIFGGMGEQEPLNKLRVLQV